MGTFRVAATPGGAGAEQRLQEESLNLHVFFFSVGSLHTLYSLHLKSSKFKMPEKL